MNLREYKKGDNIIVEGEEPDCLFEMIEGSARVEAQGAVVGSINSEELFGEVSFLTESKRTATVIAESYCLVNTMNGESFDQMNAVPPSIWLSDSPKTFPTD